MKKTVAAITALLTAGLMFAEVNNQKGILNDQSDYIDVNYWQGVNPDNIYFTVDFASTSGLDIGAAKDFGKLYVAASYYGNMWKGFTETTTTSGSTTTKTNSSSNNENSVSFLLGYGDWAIKPFFENYYKDISGTTTYSSSSTTATTITDKNVYHFGITAGYNMGSFNMWLTADDVILNDKITVISSSTTTDSSYNIPELEFGLKYVKDSKVKQTFGGIVDIFGQNSTSDSSSAICLALTPTYKVEINPVKNLYLAADASMKSIYINSKNDSETSNYISLAPTANVYLNYAIKPELVLFVTLENTIPTLSWTITDDTDDSSKKVEFTTGSLTSQLSTGFGYFFNQNVAMNIDLNIYTSGSNYTTLWDLVDTNFTVSLSCKF